MILWGKSLEVQQFFNCWICRKDENVYFWGSAYAWLRQHKWHAIQMGVFKVPDSKICDSFFKESYQKKR